MADSEQNKKSRLTQGSIYQIQILTAMSEPLSADGKPRHYQVHEVAEKSRMADEKETLRFLYILEGQKLVTPFPSGDFTAKYWHITEQGVDTLKHITDSLAA